MTKTRAIHIITLVAMAVTLGGCQDRLETQTFRVDHLQPWEVSELLAPYVYAEREGAPGAASTSEGAITVRETTENLERIRAVLAEFDRPRSDIRLYFQLIEADGFTESDPRIAHVEDELRKLFQFEGYQLAGEATVTVTDQSTFAQGLRSSDGMFELHGGVSRNAAGGIRLSDVALESSEGWRLETSVNVQDGQTLVLGSQPKGASDATLFLTVRAERVSAPGAEQ